jgi:hypothetical protein
LLKLQDEHLLQNLNPLNHHQYVQNSLRQLQMCQNSQLIILFLHSIIFNLIDNFLLFDKFILTNLFFILLIIPLKHWNHFSFIHYFIFVFGVEVIHESLELFSINDLRLL